MHAQYSGDRCKGYSFFILSHYIKTAIYFIINRFNFQTAEGINRDRFTDYYPAKALVECSLKQMIAYKTLLILVLQVLNAESNFALLLSRSFRCK